MDKPICTLLVAQMRRWVEVYGMINFKPIAILILLVIAVSCSGPSTSAPDNDLVSAILLGDMAQVQQALDKGANVNAQYRNGMTPLMYACKEFKRYHGEAGANVAVDVKVDLTESKTSVDVHELDANASGFSQTVKGNRAIVELLLAKGADVHARSKDGETALSLAIKHNLPDIAEILRQAGARE